MIRRAAAGLTFALLSTTAISAAEFPLSTRIDAVTVYADGASVTRQGDIKTPAGEHLLILSGLPQNVDPDTIRISGQNLDGLIVSSIDARVTPGSPQDESAYANKRLVLEESLNAERGKLEGLAAQRNSMLKFSNALPSQLSGEKSALEVEKWPSAWQAIGQGINGINKEIQAVNRSIAEIEASIAALDNAMQGGGSAGQPNREIAVSITAETDLSGTIVITYQTYGASWRPVYDARLLTGGQTPALELTRRASISQTTGEDWSDVALSLSTVSLNRSTAAPALDTLAVNIEQPMDLERKLKGGVADSMTLAEPVPAAPAEDAGVLRMEEKPMPAMKTREQGAAVSFGAYQATFAITDKVTLPADGTQKTVLLSRSTEKPELIIKTVPALDATAYLEAVMTLEGDAPLLPGSITLRRDETFIGRSSVDLTPPGEKIALGFGADDFVSVTRVPLRKRDNDPNPNGTRTTQQDYKTTVTNRHDFPVKVTVLDRLPVSENTAITIEPLPTNTAATEKNVDQKRGVMRWALDLAPNEAKDVRFGWRMRSPADRTIGMVSISN